MMIFKPRNVYANFFASSAFFGAFALSLMSTFSLCADVFNLSTHVNYADLQDAIDDANSGDTLLIKGKQIGNFVINKDLTLRGEKNAVLDGNQTGTVLTVGSISNIVAYVRSLTIQNGLADNGGGIVNDATLNLFNVEIINNTATANGGGIYASTSVSHTSLNDCDVEYNSSGINGGGIANTAGGLVITHSKISHNVASNGEGGGVYSSEGIAIITISDTKIENNSTPNGAGGGIFIEENETLLDDVKIKRNRAINGGGVYIVDSIINIKHSELERNIASELGGGLYNQGGVATFRDSEVERNNASTTGGGIYNDVNGTLNLIKTEVKHNNPNNIFQQELV